MENAMTYRNAGVKYDALDPFKRVCQRLGLATARNMERLGMQELPWSRGESVYLVRDLESGRIIGHVEEGLGTKNRVAKAYRNLCRFRVKAEGQSFYDNIAQCCVAMIANDMATLGVMPVSLAMHLATGDSDWFKDERRARELAEGWKKGCDLARCSWGCGETPALLGIVNTQVPVLSGSSWGVALPRKRFLESLVRHWRHPEPAINPANIQDGDAIILLESSGVHANCLTLMRQLAEDKTRLPKGYMETLPDGETYGWSLLRPTHIYVGAVEDCLKAGVDIHYAVNITGHGWRKLMRAHGNFSYEIEERPEVPPVLEFICQKGPVAPREAYGNFNMGAGFALYVPQKDVEKTLRVINGGNYGFKALHAGTVKASPKKQVVIKPVGLVYEAESLAVR